MEHRIDILLVCQLLYCLYDHEWMCVCAWRRPIIVQPNITDLILYMTTLWPTWFLQQISLVRNCDKTQAELFALFEIYAVCVSFAMPLFVGAAFKLSAFGHRHQCLLILWWRQAISFWFSFSFSIWFSFTFTVGEGTPTASSLFH